MSPLLFTLVVLLVRGGSAFCPHGCDCDDVRMVVVCQNAQLDVIPITLNPTIQRLHLQHNKIFKIDASLQFYGQLVQIDMSNNKIRDIPDRSFSSQHKLVELNMNGNRIVMLGNKTFVGLKALKVLQLRSNNIEELQANLFSHLEQLEELDLGRNQISSIHGDTFAGLSRLRVLRLDHNAIVQVPATSFKPLANLIELFIGLNRIVEIPANAFQALHRLKTLDLHGASIFNISDDAFAGATAIRTLVLSSNALEAVPTRQLHPIKGLRDLKMGKNFIEVIPNQALAGLRNLRLVDFSETSTLVAIQSHAFEANPNLDTLILDGTLGRTLRIDPGSLRARNLRLRSMGLVHLDEDVADWGKVESVDLSDNPLHCSCRLEWLREFLVRSNKSEVVCAHPERLKGVRLVEAKELECDEPDLNEVFKVIDEVIEEETDRDRQILLVVVCVSAAVVTGLVVLFFVHCRKRTCRIRVDECCACCDESDREPIQCCSVDYTTNKGQTARAKEYEFYADFNTVNTKSSYCDDDYFLSLSKDRKTLKPIPVSEL